MKYEYYLKEYPKEIFQINTGFDSRNITITNDPNFDLNLIDWKVRLIKINEDGTISTTKRREREKIELTFNEIRRIFKICYTSFPKKFNCIEPQVWYNII